jgi:hypothetical protein
MQEWKKRESKIELHQLITLQLSSQDLEFKVPNKSVGLTPSTPAGKRKSKLGRKKSPEKAEACNKAWNSPYQPCGIVVNLDGCKIARKKEIARVGGNPKKKC